MHTITVTAQSAAPPTMVWALLADIDTWPQWAAFDAATLEHEGAHERNGVGAVRRLERGGRSTRERVVAFDPPYRLGYELLSGVPVRDYRADVKLAAGPRPSETGTTITWQASFRGRFPFSPRLVKRKLEAFIADTATRLARAAEVGAPGSGADSVGMGTGFGEARRAVGDGLEGGSFDTRRRAEDLHDRAR